MNIGKYIIIHQEKNSVVVSFYTQKNLLLNDGNRSYFYTKHDCTKNLYYNDMHKQMFTLFFQFLYFFHLYYMSLCIMLIVSI